MLAKISNICIRGCEPKTNKNGEGYLLVRFEDETGKPQELVDKEMSRRKFYKRDTNGDFDVDIQIGKWTNLRIVDFHEKK